MTGTWRILFIAGALFAESALSALAQWNNELANTPILIQTDFGPYGTQLPGDGGEYCEPTSVTMNLFWAASNGFTQLAPTPTAQSELNLDLVMAGLMQTTASGGTTTGGTNGVDTYFAAMGISTTQYKYTGYDPSKATVPIIDWLKNNFDKNNATDTGSLTMQIMAVARYTITTTGTWNELTGHLVDPVSADTTTGTLVIINPQPSSFQNVLNVPASDPQYEQVTALPPGITLQGLPGDSSDYSQIVSSYRASLGQSVVIKGADAWSIDVSALPGTLGYTINPWEIDTVPQYINTNGGTFTVIAPTYGSGGFQKAGDGAMILTGTNTLSGINYVTGGTLTGSMSTSTPFGTGLMVLVNDSVLQFQPPDATPADINQTLASGLGSLFYVTDGGGTLLLSKGNNNSLTVTIGGNTDGTTANIVLNNAGTLIIKPDAGLAALGNSIKVLVAGTGGNLPGVVNGMVAPSIVGQDTDSSGAFLTYTGTNGFTTATTVLSSNVGVNDASITATTIYNVNTTQNITGSGTVSVFALEVGPTTLGETAAGSTIQVGDQGAGDLAGIILNGGTIATSNLNLGAAEGLIYDSNFNGTISAQINGTGGLTTFGPGNLTIISDNAASLSGTVNVNQGSLIAANTSGSATGSGPVMVSSNATLQINTHGSVSGTVTITNNATLFLNGGTTTGSINVAAAGTDTSEPGGLLQGHGTVNGPAVVSGMIKAGPQPGGTIYFQSSADLSSSEFFWQLNALVDNSTPGLGAGVGWNSLQFDLSDLTQLGTTADPMTVYFDFSLISTEGPDNTSVAFWNTSHQWTLFKFTDLIPPDWNNFSIKFSGGDFADGSFTASGSGDAYIVSYTPVPEPGTWLLLGCGLAALVVIHLQCRGKRHKYCSPSRL